MHKTLLAVAVTTGSLFAVVPATAADNPAGCKENGQTVAAVAQALQPFGQFVRTQTPINDEVAAFKTALCGG